MTDEQQLEDVVQFGERVQQFLRSDIGQYLLDRSKAEIDDALQRLKDVEPQNSNEIRQLQSIVKRNESVEQWLGEALQAGWDAKNILAGEEM